MNILAKYPRFPKQAALSQSHHFLHKKLRSAATVQTTMFLCHEGVMRDHAVLPRCWRCQASLVTKGLKFIVPGL